MFMGAGTAIFDLFTVECTGWKNCLEVDNDRLIYSYFVSPKDQPADWKDQPADWKDQPADWPIYSGQNSTAKLYFPVGDYSDDYQNEVTIFVGNYADYEGTFYVYPITVSRR